MNRPIASVTAVGMLLLIGLALPPPGTADDQTPPDQSPNVTERGVGDVLRPPPRPDLVGQKQQCGVLGEMIAVIVVINRGTAPAGAFNTRVNSRSLETIKRTDALPPGEGVTYYMQITCLREEEPCPATGIVDADGEVMESNETNNVFSFTCP